MDTKKFLECLIKLAKFIWKYFVAIYNVADEISKFIFDKSLKDLVGEHFVGIILKENLSNGNYRIFKFLYDRSEEKIYAEKERDIHEAEAQSLKGEEEFCGTDMIVTEI